MRARKRKSDLPLKLSMHLTINRKLSRILNANTMVQTMGNTHLYLRDHTRINAKIHCGPNQHDNVMRNLLVTTILTQYHVSKGLTVFGEPGVAAFLKELKQMHNRMVMDKKNADKITTGQKKAAIQYLMFLKKNKSRTKRKGGAQTA